jgi:hypothetical protein
MGAILTFSHRGVPENRDAQSLRGKVRPQQSSRKQKKPFPPRPPVPELTINSAILLHLRIHRPMVVHATLKLIKPPYNSRVVINFIKLINP